MANMGTAGTEHVPRDGAANGAAGLAGTAASSLLEPPALHIPLNPEALSCFSLACFPGKITDAFNSLARRSNFRAISKKLGLVCPHGAAGLPLCPWPRWCQKSSGQSVPVPSSPGSAPPETRTAWGQSCCCRSRQQRGFSPGQGVTAGFPVCPDSGPQHSSHAGSGARLAPCKRCVPAPGLVLAACSCLALGDAAPWPWST